MKIQSFLLIVLLQIRFISPVCTLVSQSLSGMFAVCTSGVLPRYIDHITVFENHQKSRIFKKSPKWTIFGIFNELLSTQNGNVARFARNVECDFLCGFQPLCLSMNVKVIYATRWSQNPAEEKKLALTNWTQHFMLHSLAHQFTRFQNHPKKSHFSKMRNFLK